MDLWNVGIFMYEVVLNELHMIIVWSYDKDRKLSIIQGQKSKL